MVLVSFRKRKYNRTFVDITPLEDTVQETVAKVAPEKAAVKAPAPVATVASAAVAAAPAAVETTGSESAPAAADAAAPAAVETTGSGSAPAAADAAALPKGVKQDDLKLIEGVGPKIAEILVAGGLDTWAKVAASTPEAIKELLTAAGSRYALHNPGTWPKQAELATQGKFEELKAWQDELDGGK